MLALSLSARMKPGVGSGLCRDDGKVAECGVGSGEGLGLVDVAAASAFAEADDTSSDEVEEDVAMSASGYGDVYV